MKAVTAKEEEEEEEENEAKIRTAAEGVENKAACRIRRCAKEIVGEGGPERSDYLGLLDAGEGAAEGGKYSPVIGKSTSHHLTRQATT